MTARFDDCVTGRALVFPEPREVLVATDAAGVRGVLDAVSDAARAGLWASGFLAYEAAPAFDRALTVRGGGELPLAWFALSDAPASEDALASLPEVDEPDLDWSFDWTPAQHADRVRQVRDRIAAGDTYQCNLATRLTAPYAGGVEGVYRGLADRQRGAFHALIDTGRWVIASASPELFFSWAQGQITTRPMKGTTARGATPDADAAARARLLASGKDRAENVMIVDLLRNDLSRVCDDVRVTRLLDCEAYPTVWQLTSTITGGARPDADLARVLGALFPCGSVTGAPKASTMGLIADLEDAPRGAYCGAVGWVAPPGSATRAVFNVPIRTVQVDRDASLATYGVGGGIVWDSRPDEEWAEVLAKSRVLTPSRRTLRPADDRPPRQR